MAERRTQLLDAAVEVVGTQGLRALTHRAVDAGAGLPAGSASNVFRSRSDLVAGLLDHLLERETAAWADLLAATGGDRRAASEADRMDRLTDVLAGMVSTLCGPARTVTLARHALFHEAAFDPGLQHRIITTRRGLRQRAEDWLADLRVSVSDEGLPALLAVMDGLMIGQLAAPDPDFDPRPALRAVLGAVVVRSP